MDDNARNHPLRSVAVAGAIAVVAVTGALAPTAWGEGGDGGDPTFVNLRTDFPSPSAGRLKLGPTLTGDVRAYTEAGGPQETPFTGSARLGLDRSGPGLVLRRPIVKVRLAGSAGERRPLEVRLTSRQRSTLRRAARRAGAHSLVLDVRLSGKPQGQEGDSKANDAYRVSLSR